MEKFKRKRGVWVGIVLLVLIAGYALMSGPQHSQNEFNEALFNFRRLTLAPLLILLAYGSLVFIIFKKS